MVLANIAKSPVKSVRRISQELMISKSLVHYIFLTHKFYLYKVYFVHALYDDDDIDRLEFCKKIHDHMDSLIFFGDKVIFYLNSQVNWHNICYWSEENPK